MVKLGKLIQFDPLTKQIKRPTLLLETRSGKVIGMINYTDLNLSFTAKGLQEISFTTHKVVDGKECEFWDKLRGLAVIRYMVDGDKYIRFEASFSVIDSDETVKTCNAVSLETELGQRILREFYVNDPNFLLDWLDYDEETGMATPTVLYNENDPAHSLLNRAIERVPQWSIGEVSEYFSDGTNVNRADTMQRTFTVNGQTVYDFLEGDVCKEFGCVFKYDTVNRTINCYNLEPCVWMYSSSVDLNGKVNDEVTYRLGVFYDKDGNPIDNDNAYYPDSEGIMRKIVYQYCEGVGKDTGVLLSKNRLANSFQIDENKDSVKNLFHITAGDDIMTYQGVAAANVTGTTDIVLFDNFVYEDMSDELRERLLDEDTGYINFLKSEQVKFYGEPDIVNSILTATYTDNPSDLDCANTFYTQFTNGTLQSGLYLGYANSLTKEAYYEHEMSPSTALPVTTAQEELNKIISKSASDLLYVASKPTSTGYTTVTSTLDDYFNTYIDTRYKVEIDKSSTSYTPSTEATGVWRGIITVTRVADETDTATSNSTVSMNVKYVNGSKSEQQMEYIEYNKQKILMKIYNGDLAGINMVVNGQFITDGELRDLLKQYGLAFLKSYLAGINECIAVLLEMANKFESDSAQSQSYNQLVAEWVRRREICQTIYNTRETQVNGWIDIVTKLANEVNRFQSYLDIQRYLANIYHNGTPIDIDTMCEIIGVSRDKGNQILEKYFAGVDKAVIYDEATGTSITITLSDYDITVDNDLYKEYCSYIRENEYQNSNYISDGLNDAEILRMGKELINVATKELKKTTVLQRSISGDFNNIFAVEELERMYDNFDLYNYVRCSVDGHIYKLRLMQVSFSEEQPESLPVTFAQYIESIDGNINDVQNILNTAQSISSSYSATYQQARSGGEAGVTIKSITNEGLNSSKVLIKNSDAEEVIIDNTGVTARSMNDVGAYGQHQLKIIGNGMYMTNDAWDSVSMAVGLGLYEGDWVYGVWADLLVGKLILGEKMVIGDEDGNVVIQNDLVKITNMEDPEHPETSDYTQCTITTSGENVFNITARIDSDIYDIFGISKTGKLSMADNLYITSKNFEATDRIGRILLDQYDYYAQGHPYYDYDLDLWMQAPKTERVVGKTTIDGGGISMYKYSESSGVDLDNYTSYTRSGVDIYSLTEVIGDGELRDRYTASLDMLGLAISYDYDSNNLRVNIGLNEWGLSISNEDDYSYIELDIQNMCIYGSNADNVTFNISTEGNCSLPDLYLDTFDSGSTEVGGYLSSLDSAISTINSNITALGGTSSYTWTVNGTSVNVERIKINDVYIYCGQGTIAFNKTSGGTYAVPIVFHTYIYGITGYSVNLSTAGNPESYIGHNWIYNNNTIDAYVYTPSSTTQLHYSFIVIASQ